MHRTALAMFSCVLVLTAVATIACSTSGWSAGGPGGPPATITAANPFDGTPVRWTEMPESANQANCGRFAAQSELEVSATAGEICVRGQISQLLPDGEQWQGEMEEVISNGSGQSGKSGEGWTATVESPPPTMVTRCLTPSSDTLILWVQRYDTCVANKDTQGLPVLTERSQFLYFGRARWTFPAATAQTGR